MTNRIWLIAGTIFAFTGFAGSRAWAAGAAPADFSSSSSSSTSSQPSLMPGTTVPVEPFVSPLGAKKGTIVSGFGKREVPGQAGKIELHDGIDFSVTPGIGVRAARSGKVLFA